jgi:hypothetical protein
VRQGSSPDDRLDLESLEQPRKANRVQPLARKPTSASISASSHNTRWAFGKEERNRWSVLSAPFLWRTGRPGCESSTGLLTLEL